MILIEFHSEEAETATELVPDEGADPRSDVLGVRGNANNRSIRTFADAYVCLVGNDVYHINVFVLLVVVLTCSTKDYPSLARAQRKWPRLVCV